MKSDKKIFLVVDDDTDDQDLFCEAVREIDATSICATAEHGEDAMRQLRLGLKPDFIFLDLNMPRMNGWKCLAELKKDSKLKDVPVIIFTTSNAQRDRDETMALGATYFITKPLDFEILKDEIMFVMQKDWSQKDLAGSF